MSSMRLMGPQKRAQELKQAANRLHWEVTEAAERPGSWGVPASAVEDSLFDLAEAMGIIVSVTEILDELFPAGSRQREQFAAHLEFFRTYHQVPR